MPVRILLVDDEVALLDLLKRYLERLTYSVDACASPEDAVAKIESEPEPYSLVLTDLTLPGMNGEDLLRRLREHQPGIKAIITSGYPHQPRTRGDFFLQKPFLPKMLADAISRILKNP